MLKITLVRKGKFVGLNGAVDMICPADQSCFSGIAVLLLSFALVHAVDFPSLIL